MIRSSRSYEEVSRLYTFEERFQYLVLGGAVGAETFGFERWLNQQFYQSWQWKQARSAVIARDEARDLGIPGFEIHTELLVHHINPMTPDDIQDGNPMILDPNNLITTTLRTHNAIHYGDQSAASLSYTERRPGDTDLW